MTMTIKAILLLAPLYLLGACGSSPATDKEERLIGVSLNYDKQDITVTVVSHGCTVKNDFTINLQNDEIIVKRKKKDECKSMPEAVSFTYSLQEAGISPDKAYTIKNKFIANPNLAGIR